MLNIAFLLSLGRGCFGAFLSTLLVQQYSSSFFLGMVSEAFLVDILGFCGADPPTPSPEEAFLVDILGFCGADPPTPSPEEAFLVDILGFCGADPPTPSPEEAFLVAMSEEAFLGEEAFLVDVLYFCQVYCYYIIWLN